MQWLRLSVAHSLLFTASSWGVLPSIPNVAITPRLSLMAAQHEPEANPRAAFIHHIVDSLDTAAFVKFTLSSNAAQKDVSEEGAVSYEGDPMQRCVFSLRSSTNMHLFFCSCLSHIYSCVACLLCALRLSRTKSTRLKNVYGRVVLTGKDGARPQLQFLLRYEHRDVTRNVPLLMRKKKGTNTNSNGSNNLAQEVEKSLASFLGADRFQRGRLFTSSASLICLSFDGIDLSVFRCLRQSCRSFCSIPPRTKSFVYACS